MSSIFLEELVYNEKADAVRKAKEYPDGSVCKYHTVNPADKLSGMHVYQKDGKNGYSKVSCDAARAAWAKSGTPAGKPEDKDDKKEEKWCLNIPPGDGYWCDRNKQIVPMVAGALLLVLLLLKK